jgi:hypothetical protein
LEQWARFRCGPDPPADSGDEIEDVAKLPAWAQRIIKETRDEAKQRRLDLKKLEDQKREEETKRLEEEGKWKTLAEKHAAEIETLKPTAERLTLLEQKMQATNEVRVKRIPEAMRSVIPTDYDPIKLSDWLDKNEGLLTTPSAPTGDGGQRGDGKKPDTLTPDELAMAKRMGLTPEQYMKAKPT